MASFIEVLSREFLKLDAFYQEEVRKKELSDIELATELLYRLNAVSAIIKNEVGMVCELAELKGLFRSYSGAALLS